MYKFYWNNLQKSSSSHKATAGLDGQLDVEEPGGGAVHPVTTSCCSGAGHVVKPSKKGGSCCSSNGSSCTSSYSGSCSDSGTGASLGQSHSGVHTGQMPLVGVRGSTSAVPEVPHRNGVTVRVKDDHKSGQAGTGNPHASSGSHRVLLKLRRMSGGASSARPKSVPDSSEIEGVVNGSATFANLAELKLAAESGTGQPTTGSSSKTGSATKSTSRMKSSKSLHHFYNKTWNEKSLSKLLRHESGENQQHNYENIYSSDKEAFLPGYQLGGSNYLPVYENMYLGSGGFSSLSPTINGCSLNGDNNNGPLKINQLTQSPTLHARASRNRDRNQRHQPLGGRSGEQAGHPQKILFRSKSCERPKMKDAMRDTLRLSTDKFQSNFSRFSSKFGHSPTMSNFSTVDGECDNLSIFNPQQQHLNHHHNHHHSLFQSVASKAIPCVDVQKSHHYHGSLSLGPGLSLQSYLDGDLKSPECQNTSMDEEKASIVSSSSSTNSTSTSNMSSGAVNRPSLSLAHKMKGFRQDVQKRFSRLRSRSAERISQRSMMGRSPERSLPDPESPKVSGGHILPSPTLASQETVYNGPFLGRARALVDYTPSPYDKDALRFKRGDVIDIISMNPSGLWKGKCQNRVGNFKFINVEILPHPRSQSQPREASRQVSSPERTRECHYRQASDPHHHKKAAGHLDRDDLGEEAGERGRKGSHGVGAPSQRVNRPKTVDELLKKIGLEEHISVFVLNGYEDLDSFQDMDEAELDYLGITNHQHRAKLMTAVQLLQDTATIHSGESSDVDVNGSPTKSPSKSNPSETFSRGSGFRRLSFPRDSGCFASSENLPSHGHHRSSPASDRSSHSGVSSHPESGIHIPEGAEGSSSLSSSDDDTITSSHNLSPMKRSADQVAKARSLRDRHTANMDELEFTREMLSSANRRGSKFDSLVEKYSDKKRPNFELQFKSARSVFEQNNSSPLSS